MSCECNPTATAVATPAETAAPTRRPAFHVSETDGAFDVEVFVPGADRAGVEISLEDDVLAITAKRAASVPATWRPLNREIPAGDFHLKLAVNAPVNQAGIQATVEHGVLRLSLPKAEQAKPRRIDVN